MILEKLNEEIERLNTDNLDDEDMDDIIFDEMTELILSLDPTKFSAYQQTLYDDIIEYLQPEDPLGYEDIDIDELDEEQLIDLLEYSIATSDIDLLLEVQRKRVIRHGKIVRKIKCPAGKKAVRGRCVRMTAAERRRRRMGQRRGKIKRRTKRAQMRRNRRRSMRKRRNW